MLHEWSAGRLARLDERERAVFLEALSRLSEKREQDICEG